MGRLIIIGNGYDMGHLNGATSYKKFGEWLCEKYKLTMSSDNNKLPFSRFSITLSTSCFLCGVSFSYAAFFSSLLKDNFHLLYHCRLAVLVTLVIEVHQVVYRVSFRNYDDGSISYVVFLHFSCFSPYKFYFSCIFVGSKTDKSVDFYIFVCYNKSTS